jgi:class 3 adenylate cyclase
MICPRCGANVAIGRKFCSDCGSPLIQRCNACGSENLPGKRFCGDCGALLMGGSIETGEVSAPKPVTFGADRRQLTIMFVDLVGSTMLAARFDPEDMREVIAIYQDCVSALVAQFDGFVARYVGDGLLVYFGYPHAHEDDPERAMRAGLAIVEGVAQLNTIAGPPGTLSTRIGIATGLVVVGNIFGPGSSLESAVVGETPNLAARLQTLAEPNTIVVSDATKRLAGSLFEYAELGPINLKGLSSPVPAWKVLGESKIDSRFEALRSGQVPLVGRTEEFELLLRRWEQAKSGEGRVVLLAGDPGIGKSHLVAALEQRIGDGTQARVRFFCSAHYQDTPLHPLIRYLERAANFHRDDPPPAKWNKLRSLLEVGGSSGRDIALLADLLSIPEVDGQLPSNLTPQRKKEMTFAAILRQFDNLARRMPVLAVFEDIQWVDPTTLDLLSLLVERIEQLPILLIITTRTEIQPSWATRPQVTVQLLNGLNLRQAASLIKEVARDRNLPKDVVDRIIARADGVPLFLEELTETILEGGLLRSKDDRSSEAESLSADVVPSSLQASLMVRLDRLATGKEVAQTGSVIGREFTFELMQLLSILPIERLEQGLGELVQAGLIIARGHPPSATYTFKHALVQDAAYASLLRDRRRVTHLRLAEALEKEKLGAATTEPQLLAWHFAEAAAPEKSIDNYLKAAEQATGRFALVEMVSYLRKGLRQIQHLPDSVGTRRRELALQVALGRALIDHQGSGSEEVRAAFERARQLCLALDETEQLVPVHDGLMNYHFTHSEPQKVLGYASEMLDVGKRTGNPHAFVMARRSAGFANLLLGRFADAHDELQHLIRIYETERDGPHAALALRDPKASGLTGLGICLTAMGYPDAGAEASLQGLQHAETLNHAISLILALRRACVQRIMQRDTQGVMELSDRLIAANTEYETFLGTREVAIFHGWAQLQNRRKAKFLDRMQTCLEELDAAKHWALLPFFIACTAEVMGDQGDRDGATALLERSAELANVTSEQWCVPEIIRLQAQFSARDSNESDTLLQASLAQARKQGAKLWELRAAISLAKNWRDQGKQAAARDVLSPIYAWFTQGLDTPDLVTGRALLVDLERHHP